MVLKGHSPVRAQEGYQHESGAATPLFAVRREIHPAASRKPPHTMC